MKLQTAVTLMTTLAALSACGELAYKRGAGQDMFNTARAECSAMQADRAAYDRCMGEKGWAVQRLDEPDPVDTIAATSDNRSTPTAPNDEAVPSAAPSKPADPMDRFRIGSWWKFGGTPDGLKAATESCVASLGEAYRPVPGSKEVTRAMLVCLKTQGWRGVREP